MGLYRWDEYEYYESFKKTQRMFDVAIQNSCLINVKDEIIFLEKTQFFFIYNSVCFGNDAVISFIVIWMINFY